MVPTGVQVQGRTNHTAVRLLAAATTEVREEAPVVVAEAIEAQAAHEVAEAFGAREEAVIDLPAALEVGEAVEEAAVAEAVQEAKHPKIIKNIISYQ